MTSGAEAADVAPEAVEVVDVARAVGIPAEAAGVDVAVAAGAATGRTRKWLVVSG